MGARPWGCRMHGTGAERVTGFWRAAGLVLAGLLGLAQGAAAAPDSPQCRIECAATFPERSDNTAVVQTCLARCTARAAALGSANVTGTMAMPTPQTPWTQAPSSSRPPTQSVAPPREQGRQAQRMAQRQAARQAGTPGRRGAPPRGQTVLGEVQPAPAPNPPAPAPSFFGSLMAAQAAAPGSPGVTPVLAPGAPLARAPDAGRAAYGAIYLAAAPSRGYGLVVGVSDRGIAHRMAESACKGETGNSCRMVGDFTLRCAAIAHGLRPNGAVVMTAHPSTFTVMAGTSGTGPTREDAEREALAACAQRGRGLTCRVTEARCAN